MSRCPTTDNTGHIDFLTDFAFRLEAKRIPFSGSIELTRRCNFSCVHCYLGEEGQRGHVEELPASTWLSILDQAADAGCLFLLITGGEPTLRDDFGIVYRHAKRLGMIVTIFTNGSNVTPEMLDLFHDYPPYSVEVTLYGASEKTYSAVTRRSGMFKRVLNNIDRLLSAGVKVQAKTVLMKENIRDAFAMEELAEKRGIRFRFDPAIFPGLDGGKSPLVHRVSCKDAAEIELASDARLSEWISFYRKMEGWEPSGALYECSAGRTNFHVDSQGKLTPCLLVASISYDLVAGDFMTGWRDVAGRLTSKMAGRDSKCNKCRVRPFCGYCPGFFLLETGSEYMASSYICELGHTMADLIEDLVAEGLRCHGE